MISLAKKDGTTGIIMDAYNQFLSRKEIYTLIMYVCLFIIYSLRIVPKDIILGLVTVIFSISSLNCSLLMYLFFTLWEDVTVFSFGITLSMVLQLIMLGKMIIYYLSSRNAMFYKFSDIAVCAFGFFYGVMDFIIGTGGLSGISVAIDLFIVNYAFNIYRHKDQSDKFWKAVFFTIMVSTFIAVIYGLINSTSFDRWIVGLGSVKQLYGTVGTARVGMYLCASLIYPIFYLKKGILKIALCVLLCLAVFMTYSITALICLGIFWTIVILFKNKNNLGKLLKKFGVISILIVFIVLFWRSISETSVIKPFVLRFNIMMEGLKVGDMSTATSSRSYLAEMYLDDFKGYSLFNKLFGSFYTNRFKAITGILGVTNYSHNSYIDIMLYVGIIGIILFFVWILMKIRTLKGREEFLPVVLLKIIFLLTGFSVSMLTNCYWLTWIIL